MAPKVFVDGHVGTVGLRIHELLAVRSAGAYGFAMSSNYNSRPRSAEVLVHGDAWAVVRQREVIEDLVRGESIPEELTR